MSETGIQAGIVQNRASGGAEPPAAGSGLADLLFAGGGEVGALMRALDWAATPLGPLEVWPQSLRTTVSTCLNSRFPILVWWGPELVMLYNDAYVALIGAKHPHALGAPGRAVFPEIWDIIGPMLGGVLTRGQATWSEDQLLLLERRGFQEECYFTFSYSPIRAESSGVGGVFTAVTETTARIIGERRLATLGALAERAAVAHSVPDAAHGAAEVLAGSAADLPFTLLYLLDEDARSLRLAGATHITAGTLASPLLVPLGDDAAQPPSVAGFLAEAVRTRSPQQVPAPAAGDALEGWPAEAAYALALPVARAGQEQPHGVLLAGLGRRLALDADYLGFLHLVAGQLATALGNAEAYEAERRRAEALAELDRAKTAFFSNISHEFRTPLTLLLSPAEDALADPHTDPATRDRLVLIHRNALRLQRLVNTLLEFSRIEAGRVHAAFEPTDLAEFTAELASSFRSAVERAGLQLKVDCAPGGPPVYVDREMWEKVVLNLLSNAFKHTFEGRIEVVLRHEEDHAELVVRDTGVGIPPDQIPHLFDRFHRVPNARARSHEGTGIGLALVQELVRLHGGWLEVKSQLGAGSSFSVHLPHGSAHLPPERIAARQTPAAGNAAAPYIEEALRWLPETRGRPPAGQPPLAAAAASALAAERPLSAPGESAGAGAQAPGARILVVDDNADMREYVTRLLTAQGWRVETAADGASALAAAGMAPPDLVLSDVMMPGLDGFALLRALRSAPETSLIPVILLSARAGEESRIEGLDAGADDYMVKPFSARELVARVSAHLGVTAARARAAAEVASAHAALSAAHARLQEQAAATEEALKALSVEQARLATLLRQAPAFICVLRGPDHVFEMANDAYYQLVGFRELLGRPLRQAVPEVADQGYVDVLDRVLQTGETFQGRELSLTLQRTPPAAPEERVVTFIYQPIVEADGSRSGILVHGVDVTEEVRARRELERARVEAEEARRAAEAANRAKSQFLAAMSHDLRTPLNAIAGYAQLLELGVHGTVTEAQREALARIRRSQQHLLTLIDDVLNFAKLEAGRVEYALGDVGLAETIAAVRQMVDPQLQARGLAFSAQLPAHAAVRADPEKLRQILLNLLSNAVKFTAPGGSITIDLGGRPGAPAGYVFLRVSDTGIGIAREKQEAIFDPFVQVDGGPTRTTEGTGLGLAISLDLARGMGGMLRVRSTVGVGSTFTLALPSAQPPLAEAPAGAGGVAA